MGATPQPQTDWFDANAPKVVLSNQGGDWFAQNSPKTINYAKTQPPDEPSVGNALLAAGKGLVSSTLGVIPAAGQALGALGNPMIGTQMAADIGATMAEPGKTTAEKIASVIPGGTPALATADAAKRLFGGAPITTQTPAELQRNMAEGGGQLLGLAALGKAGDVLENVQAERANPESGLKKVSAALETPAGRAGARAAQMEADLQAAKADLSDLAQTQPLKAKGAERFHEMAEKIEQRQQEIWDQGHAPGITRHAQMPVDPQRLVDAGRSVITDEAADAAPDEAAKAEKWLSGGISKPRNLQSLDKLIREINDDLQGKDPTRYGPLQVRVRQAVVKAARQELDDQLVAAGEQGVRDVNRRWGALDNIKDRLQERAVQEAGKEAKKGPVPDWLHLYTFLHPGLETIPLSVGAGVRVGSMLKGDAASTLGKGMAQLGRAGLTPEPFYVPPERPVAGLLTQGPLVTPPPEDASAVNALRARSGIARDPITGRMKRVYLGEGQ